jgi:enoyl-[acyl-carrier protein] reductase I
MLDLKGRRALVMGVANEYSIAWGISRSLAAAGADLALTYLPDERGRSERRVGKLAGEVNCRIVLPCDVRKDEDIAGLFDELRRHWDGLEILVHAMAWARVEDLAGDFSAVSREGFLAAHEISAYSLVAISRAARALMENRPSSILTVTYLGSQRAVPHYNVMGPAKAALESSVRYLAAELGPLGIRVNAVSPGPVETLSASAITGFERILAATVEQAPLRKNVTTKEVGDAAAFLCSDLASGITGQVIYVDGGFHTVVPV